MLKNKNTYQTADRPILVIDERTDSSVKEELLRLRRELVNEAIELVGYDPVKIEQYLNRKNVA